MPTKRHFRLLLAAAALVVLGLFSFAPPASAQDEGEPDTEEGVETGGADEEGGGEEPSHASEECIHILEDGGDIDDCQEAPNPLLPETNELIWGGLAWLVVFGFLAKYAVPALRRTMASRAERIQGDLQQAEANKTEAERILAEYRAQLADARNESGRIIEEARQQADSIRREQEARLQAELADMRQRAAADIEASKQQAIADLRGEVAALAIGAAEKVVGRNLDRDTNTQIVEQFIAQVGSQS